MADPFSANKQTQIGVESTSGTAVPANKLLPSMTLDLDETFNVTKIRGTGRRFDSIVVPAGDESSSGKLGGGVTFNELPYPMSMAWGAGALTTPAGGVNARQWKWIVPLSGRVNPKSMTIEQGDADDSERIAFAVLTDLSLDMSRSATGISGTMLGRAVEKYAALSGGSWTGMTPTPTAISLIPVLPKNWDAYMDTVPANIGSTHLSRAFKANMSYGGAFIPFFPMDSSLTSYAGVADSDSVTATGSLTLVKDAVGESLWTQARGGKTLYVRLKANGDLVDNYFTTATGTGTGGTINFTYKGVTSSNVTFSSGWSASAIQTALLAMSTIGTGNVSVSGGPLPGTAVVITMTGALATDPTLLTMNTGGVTGGTISAVLTATQINCLLQVDFAGKIQKPGPSDTNQGLRIRQWDLDIVEDASFQAGAALVVTVIDNLTAL